MRVKLLDSCRISSIDKALIINRRNFLLGSNVCAALMIGYPLIESNEAHAQYQYPLINALLTALGLAVEIYKIRQPTQGRITVVNTLDVYVEGPVFLVVRGPAGQEDVAYFPYIVPPFYQQTYAFDNGPHGISTGQKLFCGKTLKGQRTTNMIVEA